MSFQEQAKALEGKTVQVTTAYGEFTGRLSSVGTDFIILSSLIRRRRRRRIIRIAEIIALLSLFSI